MLTFDSTTRRHTELLQNKRQIGRGLLWDDDTVMTKITSSSKNTRPNVFEPWQTTKCQRRSWLM